MLNKMMRRGMAIVLSAAMLLTGTGISDITAKAAETETAVYEDTMDSKDGWTDEWSVGNSGNVTNKIAIIGGTVNDTNGWNIWSESAQTVTLSKTVSNLVSGDYKASVEIVGGSIASGKISIYEGTTEKGAKNMESFGSWPSGGSDEWATTVTDTAAIAGTSLTIKIVIDLSDGGWFWMDNVILKKITQGADDSDDTAKEAKRKELKELIDDCKALNLAEYKRAGRSLLKLQLISAEEASGMENITLQELESAVASLQQAKDALIDVNAVDAEVNVKKVEGIGSDFIRGADISTYASLMDSGVVFKDWDGEEVPEGTAFFELLKESGINYVRIRIWNDPYDADGNGYGAGNCDVEKAAKMGKWATDAGMKVLLDFHYSDFWADPGRQVVPKAWEGFAIDKKAAALEEFTIESLNTILAAGVDVGMVQVGNETNGRLCGETNWANMSKLFAAGSKAVRSVAEAENKDILIAIHFANPEKSSNMKGYAKSLSDSGIDYDVFASSYYPFWHGTLENLTSVLRDISSTYNKKVIVAETSWAYTLKDGDGQKNVVRENAGQDLSAYDISAQGQANEVRDVIEAVKNVGDAGLGIFYWEPAWIPVNVYDAGAENAAEVLAANREAWENFGSGWASSYSIAYDPNVNESNYGGSEWDNQALFDFAGNPLPSLKVFKYVETGAAVPPELESYRITYQLNGGVNNSLNPQSYTLADEVVFKAPSRAGYSFEGWYSDSLCTKAFAEIPEMTTGDLTLYAKWKAIPPTPTAYKITYQLNGGTNDKGNPASYYNQNVNLKNPVRGGYIFAGWYSDSNFKTRVTSISAASKGDITLYAKWNKVTVKKAAVKKVTNNARKKAKVVIKKVSGVKGYQVQYSTDKKFKKAVKKKNTTKTSLTLTGLKKGKTYYVRVCAYKLDSQNQKIFGKYGAVKKVKINK